MSARWLTVAVVVMLLDRACRRLVIGRLQEGEERRLAPFVRIRRHTRRRLAAGDRGGSWGPLLAGSAIILLLGLELRWTAVWRHPLAQAGLGAALGGTLVNLWDRLGGGIVDFIAIGRWPAFNVADAAITLGVALALCFAWA